MNDKLNNYYSKLFSDSRINIAVILYILIKKNIISEQELENLIVLFKREKDQILAKQKDDLIKEFPHLKFLIDNLPLE